MMGTLAGIYVGVDRILGYIEGEDDEEEEEKRKIFQTPEERAAWNARFEKHQRELQAHIERITAELAAKRKPA